MKHAILGAGAVGGLVGTALASLGEDVTVIVRPEKLPDYPAELTLERPSGTLTAPAKAVSRLTEQVDVLWIATKAFQLLAALEAVQSAPAAVVPLLNGVDHVAVLRARYGDAQVIPATIAVEAEHPAPGRFIQRSPLVGLNVAASAERLLGAIVSRLTDLGFTCQFIQNEKTLLWSKLCFLGPFALVTSASGKNKGEVYADPAWKEKLRAAVAEACAVAKADGAEIDVSKLRGTFDSFPPTLRSSVQKDLAAGRPLELDAIAGPIVRGGERYSIAVLTTKELIAAINSLVRQRV
ncbi:MAG: 2-dehydropantoate 2-reductase [Candidatus Korobacteraceae bacterium]